VATREKEELVVSHHSVLDRTAEEYQAVVQGMVERERVSTERTAELEKLSKKQGKEISAYEKK
jgi:hypothetical protein